MRFSLGLNAKYKALDGKIDQKDVADLTKSAQDFGGVSESEKNTLRALLNDPASSDKFTPKARKDLQKFLAQQSSTSGVETGNTQAKEKGFSLLGFLGNKKADSEVDLSTPKGLDAYADQLDGKLTGFLSLNTVKSETAGAELTKLAKLNDKDLEHVADRLGAGKTQRLVDALSLRIAQLIPAPSTSSPRCILAPFWVPPKNRAWLPKTKPKISTRRSPMCRRAPTSCLPMPMTMFT